MASKLFPEAKEDFYLGRYIDCYAGYSKNFDIRYHCASGGITSQLLIFMLENNIIDGALVSRFGKDPIRPESFIATSKEEVLEAKGSKYCPVSLDAGLRQILSCNGKFAVVGLPCQIHGFRKVEELIPSLKEKIFIYIGLICSSTRSFLATDYTFTKFGVKRNEIKNFTYRDEGYLGNMVINLKDGRNIKCPYADYYLEWRSFFIPHRCTLCIDHAAELSDISVGDIYIPKYYDDKIGINSIIIRSKKGKDILDNAFRNKLIWIEYVDKKEVIRSQLVSLMRKKHHMSIRFSLLKIFSVTLPDYDLFFEPKSVGKKIKYFITSVILYIEITLSKLRYLWFMIRLLNFISKTFIRRYKNNIPHAHRT